MKPQSSKAHGYPQWDRHHCEAVGGIDWRITGKELMWPSPTDVTDIDSVCLEELMGMVWVRQGPGCFRLQTPRDQ